MRDELGAWRLGRTQSAVARPFHPLPVPHDSLDPGGVLAYEVQLSCEGRVSGVVAAAERILRRWSVALDGVDGAELLFRFCAYLSAPRLLAVSRAFLANVPRMTDEEQAQLGRSIVMAVSGRLGPGELDRLAGTLEQVGLYWPIVAAELIAAQTRNQLSRIGERLAGSPLEHADGHSAGYQQLVGRLLEDHSPAALEDAWLTVVPQKVRRRLMQALVDLTAYEGDREARPADGPLTLEIDGEPPGPLRFLPGLEIARLAANDPDDGPEDLAEGGL